MTRISDYAFEGCSSLTAITIGTGIKDIGSRVFASCEELTDVYCFAENVPSAKADAFEDSYIGSATLHVPASSINSYSTTEPWSEFGEIVSSMTYTLTYMIDGQVYKKYNVDYDTPITPEPAPTKEGYTFSGWSEIPQTMPNHDVIVTGSFAINSYTLTYKVDGEVYKNYTVAYGSTIAPEPEPTKKGYTFSGWSEIPDNMPANDVTVTGTFTKDILGTCATPTISYANGKLTYKCETEDAVCQSTITDTDIASYSGNEVDLTVTYTITVYATREGYANSNTITATLCWIEAVPYMEGLEEDPTQITTKALPVLIQAQAGFITVQGLEAGTEISAYNTSGMLLDTIISSQDTATLRTKLPAGSTAIVKIGQRTVKVMVK